MSKKIKVAIQFDEKQLKGKEQLILAYQPLYEEVRHVLSDLYIVGLICENLESQGLVEIDEKEKAYFEKFKKYESLDDVENTKDEILLTSIYFEEILEEVMSSKYYLEVSFQEEKTTNFYIKESIQKWK